MPDQTLKLHDKVDAVAVAQDLLNRAGAILVDDGDFGSGTARAVREFREAHGMPDSGEIDDALWKLLRALPEPCPDIPSRAVAFIAREEVSGRDYYDKSCPRPTWPGGDSGVTIGVGYDLGYQTNFEADWSDLPAEQIAQLRPWVGMKGEAAKAAAAVVRRRDSPSSYYSCGGWCSSRATPTRHCDSGKSVNTPLFERSSVALHEARETDELQIGV